jgi:protein-tyrosine phosphatase
VFFDIHTHILPGIDDGAKDLEESIKLLKMMKKSGISSAVATSHFYPLETTYEDFLFATGEAFRQLKEEIEGKKLPLIYPGCEMLYYRGIGNSEGLCKLCLNDSKYLLLELTDPDINNGLFEDINDLKANSGIIPIIAHIERYGKARNFKNLITFAKTEKIPVQINALSVFTPFYKRTIKSILKENLFTVLATDTHSVDERPPLMKQALTYVRDNYGGEYRARLVKNSSKLYSEIIGEGK